VIVSILGGPDFNAGNCPSPTGGALSDTDFDALWSTPDGARPTGGLWGNWTGRADDFVMEKVDYTPSFHRLVLINRDPNNAASFRINGSAAVFLLNSITNPPGVNAYYTDGTVLSLCSDSTPTTVTRHTLKKDISFVFEAGLWRAEIVGVPINDALASQFGQTSATFLAAQWNSGAQKGANQQGVTTAMYSFMLSYTFWADQCPQHFPWRTATSAQQVPEYELLSGLGDNNARLDVFSGLLLK